MIESLTEFSQALHLVTRSLMQQCQTWAKKQEWRRATAWAEALDARDTDGLIRAIHRLYGGIHFSEEANKFLCPHIQNRLSAVQFLNLSNFVLLLLRLEEYTIIPQLDVMTMLDDELLSLEKCSKRLLQLIQGDLHPEQINYPQLASQYQQRFNQLSNQLAALFALFTSIIQQHQDGFSSTLQDIIKMLSQLDGLTEDAPGFWQKLIGMHDEWHTLLQAPLQFFTQKPETQTQWTMMQHSSMQESAEEQLISFQKRLAYVEKKLNAVQEYLGILASNQAVAQRQMQTAPNERFYTQLWAAYGIYPFFSPQRRPATSAYLALPQPDGDGDQSPNPLQLPGAQSS